MHIYISNCSSEYAPQCPLLLVEKAANSRLQSDASTTIIPPLRKYTEARVFAQESCDFQLVASLRNLVSEKSGRALSSLQSWRQSADSSQQAVYSPYDWLRSLKTNL